jgi:hypothetical protein
MMTRMRKKRISYIFLAVSLALYLQACGDKSNFQVSPEDLYDSKDLHVITTWFNNRHQTISILYGNEQAASVPANDIHVHQVGERYTLVTWHQQGNPLWFGGQITGHITLIEQVDINTLASGAIEPHYSVTYSERTDSISGTTLERERIDYILSRKKIEHL